MKRFLLVVAAFVAVSCSTRSASAQFGGFNFGNQTPIDETIQQQRQEILSQQQKYARPAPRGAAPASRRSQIGGRGVASARVDLSGKPAPGYPVIRDSSFDFSATHHSYSSRRRSPMTRPQAFSPNWSASARRHVR
jgi:hypothetical protein